MFWGQGPEKGRAQDFCVRGSFCVRVRWEQGPEQGLTQDFCVNGLCCVRGGGGGGGVWSRIGVDPGHRISVLFCMRWWLFSQEVNLPLWIEARLKKVNALSE